MSGDFDPRDLGARDRDDGVHDREQEWLIIGRGPGSAELRDDSLNVDGRHREYDSREERDREPREREDDGGSLDASDVLMRDLRIR